MKTDFSDIRDHVKRYKKRFPMFLKDIRRIENTIENHIKLHSQYLVKYKQTHSNKYLEKAQAEIDQINNLLKLIDKIELMAMLAK